MKLADNKVSIFKVEDKGNYVTANASEGVKDKDGNWTNQYWNLMFLGKCKEEAKMLQDKDKITLKGGLIDNKYDKEKQKTYITVKVFEFEIVDGQTKQETSGFYPIYENIEEDNSDLPF